MKMMYYARFAQLFEAPVLEVVSNILKVVTLLWRRVDAANDAQLQDLSCRS